MKLTAFRRKSSRQIRRHRMRLRVLLTLDRCESRETTNLLLVGGFSTFLGSELFALPDCTANRVALVQSAPEVSLRQADQLKSRALDLPVPVIAEVNSSPMETARRTTVTPTELSVNASADSNAGFDFAIWRFQFEPSPEPSVSLPRPSAQPSASDSSCRGDAGGPIGATLHRTTHSSQATITSSTGGVQKKLERECRCRNACAACCARR